MNQDLYNSLWRKRKDSALTKLGELLEAGLLIVLVPMMLVGFFVSIPAAIFIVLWNIFS